MEIFSAPAEIFSPVCETGLEISSRDEIQKNPHVIAFKFQPRLKSELGHAR